MPSPTIDIIKRNGKRSSEPFNRDKLYASIQAACLSVRTPQGEAELLANNVCDQVSNWLSEKPEVTSDDIRRQATNALHTFHPEAAYLYKHHRLVI